MSSSTNTGQAQPQQMQGTNIASQEVLPTPEPSVSPDDMRNEAEDQRQQAQAQQAQAQQVQAEQSQGINNIATQGGLPAQPSSPPEEDEEMGQDLEETSRVKEFIQARYMEAQEPLRQLSIDPYIAEPWHELEKLNEKIKERNLQEKFPTENGYIDIESFQNCFVEHSTIKEKMQSADETAYKGLYKEWEQMNIAYMEFLRDNDYPNDWTLAPPPSFQEQQSLNQQQLPPPADGPKILAHREMRNGSEYYVERMIGNLPYCEVKTEAQLGPSAVRAYLSSDVKVSVTDHSMKYRKKDYEQFGGVVHVACKPVHTRIVKDDGRKPRRPPTTVQILFDGKPRWVVYSDMKNMMGNEADQLIRGYYGQRNLECPWDIKPKRRLKVIEDDEDTEPEAENGGLPRRAEEAVPSVNTNKQMDFVMARLQQLTQQMQTMQQMNSQLVTALMQSQRPVIKQETQEGQEEL